MRKREESYMHLVIPGLVMIGLLILWATTGAAAPASPSWSARGSAH